MPDRLFRDRRDAERVVAGQVVILADDGLATGASMRAAVEALRQQGPARIVVAVPAAPESTCRELAVMADEVVCATTPSPFFAVGASYWDFTQVTDEEVRDLLGAAAQAPRAGACAGGAGALADLPPHELPGDGGQPSGGGVPQPLGGVRRAPTGGGA